MYIPAKERGGAGQYFTPSADPRHGALPATRTNEDLRRNKDSVLDTKASLQTKGVQDV